LNNLNTRILAQGTGAFVLLLGGAGLLMGERQVANLMNINLMLDMTRIALGTILIASSFKDENTMRIAFAIFGIVYLGNFLAALISPNMFGLLPHEYGPVDNILHLGGGILGAFLGFAPGSMTRARKA
jgi:hypothetical protein